LTKSARADWSARQVVDGGINAFDPTTGAFLGSIPINVGAGNTPGGLWFIGFGTGGNNGSPNTLYFADGINGEADGLFGALTPVPEPSALAVWTGLAFLAVWGGLRRRAGVQKPSQG
jgi:hypothetical protein